MPDASQGPHRRGLGILAGGGPLPGRVARAALAAGRDVFVVALDGSAEPDVVAPFPHETVRIGAAGRILSLLRTHGCSDVVLVGPVRRPSVLSLRPDAEGARIVARIGRAAFGGDDGLLAAVLSVLSEEGFTVVGAHEILTEAQAPAGRLSKAVPDAQAMADIGRGMDVLYALGQADVGQACVVQQGIVLAVEAIEGTDAMLERAGRMARPGPGGVLVKLPKPGQDRRADLPTIGPDTMRAAASAGLRGVVFQAGGTLITDRPGCVKAADMAGLFLLGYTQNEIEGSTNPR